jgi:nucleoside-diphosphate-sugar epimerase
MKKKSSHKILIVGSDGYLGTELYNYLKKRHELVDGLDTGFFRKSVYKKCRISKFNYDARLLKENIIKQYDTIILLAANSNDPLRNFTQDSFYKISYDFTIKIAKICKKHGKKFIFPSSCSVYGFGKKVFNEKSKTNPITGYSKNKLKIEKQLIKLANKNFSPIALRFSTVFGFSERMRFDIVINMLSALAIVKKKIILNSDGEAWRPHINITNVCESFDLVLSNKFNNGKLNVYNVGFNNNNLKIIEVAKIIKDITKCEILVNPNNSDNLVTDKKIKNGKDLRTYIVNFDKFNKRFRTFGKKQDIKKDIKLFINKLIKVKLSQKIFNNLNFHRLQKLEDLMKKKLIDKNLLWLKNTKK